LALRERFVVEESLEHAIVECGLSILLMNAKITQDSNDDVKIQRHRAVHGADGHEIQHALSVEVRLVDAKLFDRYVR
jgi:hypothetical protein